jgi:two-component system, cell cycle sensor histidine kinase and response regulator CckA
MQTSIRLLIIEDSADDSALLNLLLRQGGYALHSERVDTPDGLKQALNSKWDIIVCDYSMPHLSGRDALKMVRAEDAEVPFIFVSGTIGEDVAVDAMRNGAQDYVLKTNLKRLVPAVQRELRDVEERAERKKLDRRVQQLEKFEAIGRLVGGIAHDFNNMIGAIMGWAELGCEETRVDSRVRDRFLKICAQSVRAGKLTAQLLAFAGGQTLLPRKLNLNLVVQEEMSLLSKIIGGGIKVHVRLADDLPAILADASQIEQVLMNLCLNARDAMAAGGQLTVETKNVELDAKFCGDHLSARPGSYILLSVTDTGVGIDNDTIHHIFEPFFTTKATGKGTGLGLATVYGIVKQHGGFVVASNREGGGASFLVYLPIAVGKQDEACDAVSLNAPPRGTETILLAEDHEGLRSTAHEMLQNLGYQVVVCADGQEALDLFSKNPDGIDLLVMDVVMPSLSGPEAYREMGAIRPDIKVIFTTGYTPKAKELVSMIEKGAFILQKPYSLISLSQMIRGVLEHHATASSEALAVG